MRACILGKLADFGQSQVIQGDRMLASMEFGAVHACSLWITVPKVSSGIIPLKVEGSKVLSGALASILDGNQ